MIQLTVPDHSRGLGGRPKRLVMPSNYLLHSIVPEGDDAREQIWVPEGPIELGSKPADLRAPVYWASADGWTGPRRPTPAWAAGDACDREWA